MATIFFALKNRPLDQHQCAFAFQRFLAFYQTCCMFVPSVKQLVRPATLCIVEALSLLYLSYTENTFIFATRPCHNVWIYAK